MNLGGQSLIGPEWSATYVKDVGWRSLGALKYISLISLNGPS